MNPKSWRNLLCVASVNALACGSHSASPATGTQAPAADAVAPSSNVEGSIPATCNPTDKLADPTPASFTMIGGYGNLTTPPTTGPDMPLLETDPGLPDWTVYRPDDLTRIKHPILVWANGGCLKNGTLYGQWLLQLASYGYVVVADGKPTSSSADPAIGGIRSGGADGQPQQMALDWIIAENERPCSQFYHGLAVDKVAVAGQSCGGLMSLAAAGDSRVTTGVIFNSGLFSPDQNIYSALHTPIAYFLGGSSDIAYSNANRDFSNINSVPLFYGNDDGGDGGAGVGHGATWLQVNAGEFGRVGLGWLDWQLKGDATAQKMFWGANCELCMPPSTWSVQKKNML
jgi:hypothetical protein